MSEISNYTHGVGWKVDPKNPHQMRGLTILMVVSGMLLAIGVTLCSLHSRKKIEIPCAVRDFVLAPSNTICSSVFVMTLLGFAVSKGSQEPKKKTKEAPPSISKGNTTLISEV